MLVVISIGALMLGLSLPAIAKIRSFADSIRCRSRLRQVGMALGSYQANNTHLPPGCSVLGGKDPMPYASWLARLLPFVEHDALWQTTVAAYEAEKSFRVSPPHVGLSTKVAVFQCPAAARADELKDWQRFKTAFTCYLGVEGSDQTRKDGLLYLDSRTSLADCPDGTSQTLLVGERPPSPDGEFGWWYAGWGQAKEGSADMVLGARERATHRTFKSCPESANRFRGGSPNSQCDALHFWSMHPGGAHFLFADGSARLLDYSADAILAALATRAGGEAVIAPE